MRPSWVRGDQHEPFQVESNCAQSDPIRSWTHEHSGAGMFFTWLLGPQDTGNRWTFLPFQSRYWLLFPSSYRLDCTTWAWCSLGRSWKDWPGTASSPSALVLFAGNSASAKFKTTTRTWNRIEMPSTPSNPRSEQHQSAHQFTHLRNRSKNVITNLIMFVPLASKAWFRCFDDLVNISSFYTHFFFLLFGFLFVGFYRLFPFCLLYFALKKIHLIITTIIINKTNPSAMAVCPLFRSVDGFKLTEWQKPRKREQQIYSGESSIW